MTYQVSYKKTGDDKRFMSVWAATKAELARGLKEVNRAWGAALDFPKFQKADGGFVTGVTVAA